MNMKEEKLKGRYRDTYNALQWLRQNRTLFKGNVYEPMMLVVRVLSDSTRPLDLKGAKELGAH